MPDGWCLTEMIPIYKGKGDVTECTSSRGIKLMEHGLKVMESFGEQNQTIGEDQ